MKQKAAFKIGIDIVMTLFLLLLIGYQFWGEFVHEWIGVGMVLLFILHHALNRNWYKTIAKGKYTPFRILEVVIDLLLFADMLVLIYSGIIISKTVFAFLPVNGGLALARRLHILGSYWGFLLMSFHIGTHWNMLWGLFRKAINGKRQKPATIILPAAGFLTALYGVFAFVKRDFSTYLFLKSEFVFMDYAEPKILFYIDHLAIMGLCIFIAYCFKVCFNKLMNANKEIGLPQYR